MFLILTLIDPLVSGGHFNNQDGRFKLVFICNVFLLFVAFILQGISEKCTGAFKFRVLHNILKYLSIQKLPQKWSHQSIYRIHTKNIHIML